MSEEDLILKLRPKSFSAFAMLAIVGVLAYGLFVFGRMVLGGVRDWGFLLVFGFFVAALILFSYLIPRSIRIRSNDVTIRYLIGRTARFDLRDLSDWEWWTNTSGNSGLRLTFIKGQRLNIPSVFVDDRLPAILNRYATQQPQKG